MFKYYLLIAWRNSRCNKLYASISIVGLTLGLTAALLIGLFVQDELSYDSWLPDHQELYRAYSVSGDRRFGSGPVELGRWLKSDYPQVTAVARLLGSSTVVGVDQDSSELEFNERVDWADPEVFDVFPFSSIHGDLAGALDQPDAVVISKSIAEKYFGTDDAVGESLLFGRENPMQVTAVIADLPDNTHLDFEILGSANAAFSPIAVQDRSPINQYYGRKSWLTSTYFRLPATENLANITDDMGAMLDRHLPVQGGRKNSEIYQIELRPITDVHLTTGDATATGVNLQNVYTVSAVALLILITASINYINLMTARGAKRSREIAIRKTVGAGRKSLIFQFLTESTTYVLISCVFAVGLAALLLAPFNGFMSREMNFSIVLSPGFLLGALSIAVLTSLVAGIYPALVLSRFTPMALFQTNKPKGSSAFIR
ncbi:MAG: ABC transporter permease, partial [Gammaproteobacteria bacterium]|nr:ABC transporter permease [Gammaproteobacteria bacterium]